MSIIGSIWSGINKANSVKAAANVQTQGAQTAQKVELNNQQTAQNFQNDEWTQQKANEQPYLQAGQTAANGLNRFLQTPFQAPTLAEAQQTPGYQFTLQQGTQAIDQNAAANGTLMSGNTGTALEKYGQGLADTTYQNDYQRALDTYMANYQTLQGGTQVGQTATGQVGQQGALAANNTTNLALTGGAQQAEQINNAAAARASGYVGKANALATTVNNVNSQVQDAALLAAGA